MKKNTISIGIFILIMHGFSHVYAGSKVLNYFDTPTSNLLAYSNHISKMSYSVGSGDQHSLSLLCDKSPIAYYTPVRYEDSLPSSYRKTYFLPRTGSLDYQLKYFYNDVQDNLKMLGIILEIDEITGKYFGLQISFTMLSDQYTIVKNIDTQNNIIRFDIFEKSDEIKKVD